MNYLEWRIMRWLRICLPNSLILYTVWNQLGKHIQTVIWWIKFLDLSQVWGTKSHRPSRSKCSWKHFFLITCLVLLLLMRSWQVGIKARRRRELPLKLLWIVKKSLMTNKWFILEENSSASSTQNANAGRGESSNQKTIGMCFKCKKLGHIVESIKTTSRRRRK